MPTLEEQRALIRRMWEEEEEQERQAERKAEIAAISRRPAEIEEAHPFFAEPIPLKYRKLKLLILFFTSYLKRWFCFLIPYFRVRN